MKQHEMISLIDKYSHNLGLKVGSTAYLVLRKLIDHMNQEGHCWLKNGTLENYTGKKTRTVQYATSSLVKLGYVVKEKRTFKNGCQTANGYYLQIETMVEAMNPKQKEPVLQQADVIISDAIEKITSFDYLKEEPEKVPNTFKAQTYEINTAEEENVEEVESVELDLSEVIIQFDEESAVWNINRSSGECLYSVYEDGVTEENVYDNRGNLVGVFASDGQESINEYDNSGRLTFTRDSEGTESHYLYEDNGQVVKIFSNDGGIEHLVYNELGQLISSKIVACDGEYELEKYFYYNDSGQLVREVYSNGVEKDHCYNEQGQLISTTESNGIIETWTYDQQGKLIQFNGAFGVKINHQYDDLGRHITASHNDLTWNKEYDGKGNVVRVTNSEGAQFWWTYKDKIKFLKK